MRLNHQLYLKTCLYDELPQSISHELKSDDMELSKRCSLISLIFILKYLTNIVVLAPGDCVY